MKIKLSKAEVAANIKRLSQKSGFGLMIAFAVIFIALTISSDKFATIQNILIMLNQASFVAVIASGMTLVIAMGGIDLSVGSTLSLCGMIIGGLMLSGVNIFLAMIITLSLGFFIGAINGVLIEKVKIPDFIVTLSMMTILQGVIRVYTAGRPFYGLNWPEFTWIGQGSFLGLSVPFWIALIVTAIFYYLAKNTAFGRYTFSIGSNREAAKLVGINIPRVKILVYALIGMLAALASILVASRVRTAMPDAGLGYELKVIAATVIGGTSLSGGKGSIFGSLIGSILMIMISNGLNILNVYSSWHLIVIGVIILLTVGFDSLSNRQAE